MSEPRQHETGHRRRHRHRGPLRKHWHKLRDRAAVLLAVGVATAALALFLWYALHYFNQPPGMP
jgi:hypothetical protein